MIRYSAFSQKGATKKNNEDRVMVENRIINNNTQSGFSNNSLIAIVCDGVGSTKGGAFAAELIAKSFLNFDINTCSPLTVSRHLHKVNSSVIEQQKKNESVNDMASTVAGIIVKDGRYLSFNLGDTRIYKYHEGKLSLITKDHITTIPYNFFNSNKTAITRYIGGTGCFCYPSLKVGIVEMDSSILLCSDGIYKHISNTELERILKNNDSLEQKEKAILKRSLQNGSTDDMSLVLIDCKA